MGKRKAKLPADLRMWSHITNAKYDVRERRAWSDYAETKRHRSDWSMQLAAARVGHMQLRLAQSQSTSTKTYCGEHGYQQT